MTSKKDRPRRVPEEAAATREEIDAAIHALSVPDLVRLESAARFRFQSVPPDRRKARDAGELVAEAIAKTLDGSRSWRRSIPFPVHLRSVMRSLASHWREDANPDLAVPLSQLATDGDEGRLAPSLETPDHRASPESMAIAGDFLERIEELFSDDPLVLLLIDGLRQGYAPGKLAEELGEDPKVVAAGMKRMRLQVRESFPERNR